MRYTLLTAALGALLACSSGSALAQKIVLIEDNFSASGTLNGKKPPTMIGNLPWVAKTGVTSNGTNVPLTGAQTNTVNLGWPDYFATFGAVYEISAKITRPVGSSGTANHWGIGFHANPVTTNSMRVGGNPWIALRSDGHVIVYINGTTVVGQTASPVSTGTHILGLKLDTAGQQWKINASINSVAIDLNGSATGNTYAFPSTNPLDLRYAGFSSNSPDYTGAIDDFLLVKTIPVRHADKFVDSIGVATSAWIGVSKQVDSNGVSLHKTTIVNKLTEAGVRHIRDVLAINQPVATQIWSALKAANIRFCFCLQRGYGGAAGVPGLKSYLKDTTKGNLYTHTVILEGENEPNGKKNLYPDWAQLTRNNQTEIANTFRADPATAGIKIAAPAVTINGDMLSDRTEMGDFTGTVTFNGVTWPKVDYGNSHPYPGGGFPKEKLVREQRLMHLNTKTLPIIVTETGWHNYMETVEGHKPTLEAAAALYLPRLLLEYLQQGVVRSYLFTLVDPYPSAADSIADGNLDYESKHGLLRYDFSPKPAYTALKNLITIMNDPGANYTPAPIDVIVKGNLDVNGNAIAWPNAMLFQKRTGKYFLAIWRHVKVYDNNAETMLTVHPATITVTFPTSRAVTMYTPTTSATGTDLGSFINLNLQLKGEVVILEFPAN